MRKIILLFLATLMLTSIALAREKPIYMKTPPPSELPFYEELNGLYVPIGETTTLKKECNNVYLGGNCGKPSYFDREPPVSEMQNYQKIDGTYVPII